MDRPMHCHPWFCPSCRRTGESAPASGLCTHCGDRVVLQGYCLVCEDYLPQEAGMLCEKHDVPLEESKPDSLMDESLGPWVEVARNLDATNCHPMRIRLEGEGIPTSIQGERMGSRSMYQVATGGVSLRVPESLAADARVILSQTWSQDAAELGIEDDDWDEDLDAVGPDASPDLFTNAMLTIGAVAVGGAVVIGLFILAQGLASR